MRRCFCHVICSWQRVCFPACFQHADGQTRWTQPPQRYTFLQEFSVRAWCLTHPLQRLLPGRQRETNYHLEPAIITIREATALLPHLQRDRQRIRLFCLGNVYLYHTFAKGHGKALITGHDSANHNTLFIFCPLTWSSLWRNSFDNHALPLNRVIQLSESCAWKRTS